ncbi:MAG: SIS domain-containing protein, partial [Bacteroidota bacterium]
MNPRILSHFQEALQTLQRFLEDETQMNQIDRAATAMIEAIQQGGKIMSCGNGGSHCDAMHFAEELTGRYRDNRPAIAAIAISDVSHISCVGNDYGYDQIFSRYIEAVGRKGDVLLAISSSGNSANVIKAIETAKAKGI